MTKKIQILGTGCMKCNRLQENAEAAAKALGIDYEVEKVSDIDKIMSFGVMSTPALAVDGKVVSAGKLLTADEIKEFLK
ncbi:MAG: TM0996/MTH895 family glutaredoxin-like protein [Deltaproteobacteria bacterium]|nr:TM0996/MTH895 family glutaredoxin-like protein [Candidatus Zymogenaceae bacterium]